MYMSLFEAVNKGFHLDASASYMWDRGELVVFVPEALLIGGGL